MPDAFSQANVDNSVMDLIVDQLEELVVTLVEEIRERPGIAAAIVAAVVGALIGAAIAGSVGRPRKSPRALVARRAQKASQGIELAALGLRLMQNPLIRSFARSRVEDQIKKRAGR
jgi:hypothetical protein